MKNQIRILLSLTCVTFFSCDFGTTYKSSLSHDVGSNDLRKRLHVPIIDSYIVKSVDPAFLGGERWDAEKDFPIENEVLHFWKIIRPFEKRKGISEEEDAFRKNIGDSIGLQINIYSKIKYDSIVTRKGTLFNISKSRRKLDPSELNFRELDEKGIDSIAKAWNIYYLISNK